MFKGTCDVCGNPVEHLHQLKTLEAKLSTGEMKDICEKCGAALSAKLKEAGTKYMNMATQDAKEWLATHRKSNQSKIISG